MPPTADFLDSGRDAGKIFDTIDAGVAIFNKDRKLLYINPAMKSVTGGRNGVGWSLKDLMGRHQLRDEKGHTMRVEDFPINYAFEGRETRDVRYEYVDAVGKHTWLMVSCLCINDEAGALKYVVTTVRNISRRKSNEDKLHFLVESEKILSITADFRQRLREKAKLTVPTLADWCRIDILDESGNIERVITVHEDPQMLKYYAEYEKKYPVTSRDAVYVPTIIASMKPRFIPYFDEASARAISHSEEHFQAIQKLGIHSSMIIPIVSRGRGLGCMTLAYAQSGRIYSDDDFHFFQEFCHHIGVLLDNARLFDEILKRDGAKDVFLASLSHELRNPLAPIKSSLELVRLKHVPDDVLEEIEIIEHNFDHMAKLLNDLLDVTRFTRGAITIVKRQLDLRTIIERALKSSDTLLQKANIALHVTYPPETLRIQADETRIEQAIRNLLSNASKFTPPRGAISVELRREGDDVLISVKDTGEGIDPRDLPYIFELYYRGRNAKEAGTGLGIGLVLVDQIARLHGGSAEAKSSGPGKGSEFILRLPLHADTAHSERPLSLPRSSPAGRRVLIIDDNSAAADSLVKLFKKLGADAYATYSGQDAIAREDIANFDLILLDIGMPLMDGYEVVRQLREMGVSRSIIALTGYGMLEDKEKALHAGFDGHLTKPIGLKELNELFEQIFAVAV